MTNKKGGRPKGGVPWNKDLKTGIMNGRKCLVGCACKRHTPSPFTAERCANISTAKVGKSREPFSEIHRQNLSTVGRLRGLTKGHPCSVETKELHRKLRVEFYMDPANREAQSVRLTKVMAAPEIRQAISERQLLKWKDPEYAHKVLSTNGVRPNKSEIQCLDYLNSIEPNTWIYVGDGSLMIDGKNPDFWDGGTRLVEFAGRHWHDESYAVDRVDFFKQRGYACRVIWDYELKEMLR